MIDEALKSFFNVLVMYYTYGVAVPSLLMESLDSMIGCLVKKPGGAHPVPAQALPTYCENCKKADPPKSLALIARDEVISNLVPRLVDDLSPTIHCNVPWAHDYRSRYS